MSNLQPHQQRVVDEHTELVTRLNALISFFDNPIYKQLDYAEQERLIKQKQVMGMYADVLLERINAFGGVIEPTDITSQELKAAGKDAPRITPTQIEALLAKVTYVTEVPEGTTSTFCHAYLGRFYLATGHSACVSPENFIAATGKRIAEEKAAANAKDKLWELEGYSLYKELNK